MLAWVWGTSTEHCPGWVTFSDSPWPVTHCAGVPASGEGGELAQGCSAVGRLEDWAQEAGAQGWLLGEGAV